MREPGPDHPITISPAEAPVRVVHHGSTIAQTADALTLREARLSPVHYLAREAVDMGKLRPSTHSSHCPYKGEARYWDVVVDGEVARNAVWSYEEPYPAVAPIAGRLAFWEGRVDRVELARG